MVGLHQNRFNLLLNNLCALKFTHNSFRSLFQARFSITTIVILVFVAVVLVHARPNGGFSSNQIGGGDKLVQQGRNMLAKFIVSFVNLELLANRIHKIHNNAEESILICYIRKKHRPSQLSLLVIAQL